MNTITAQEIKRRGISAVKEGLKKGPVHVIVNNKPSYVILDEDSYDDMIAEKEESYQWRLALSLQELNEGKTRSYTNVEDLMKDIDDQP